MAFLQPEVYTGHFYIIEMPDGSTEYLPADYGTPGSLGYPSDAIATVAQGTIGRLSASGYMDCTEWSPYDSESAARSELCEEAGICEHCESDLDFHCGTCGNEGNCPDCGTDSAIAALAGCTDDGRLFRRIERVRRMGG